MLLSDFIFSSPGYTFDFYLIHIVICFKKRFSISTPKKGEYEVGEDDEEGIEGRHHVSTLLVHTV